MLTKLSLTNFKSWREIRAMRLAPITGLFGTNSSGKTSILQLLLMLKRTTAALTPFGSMCGFEGDHSVLDPLEVDPYGNIRNWPKDFFGNEFAEMAQTTMAAMRREMSSERKP